MEERPMPQKFVKKPIIVEAVEWDGNIYPDDDGIEKYPVTLADMNRTCEQCGDEMFRHGHIKTLEGWHIVCRGDYIITGVKGERYPCKPDIFEMTYEAANTAPARTPTFGSNPYFFVEGKLYDRHGKERDPREFVFFSVTDMSIRIMLAEYFDACTANDSPATHRSAINKLIMEIGMWQEEHLDRVKAAD